MPTSTEAETSVQPLYPHIGTKGYIHCISAISPGERSTGAPRLSHEGIQKITRIQNTIGSPRHIACCLTGRNESCIVTEEALGLQRSSVRIMWCNFLGRTHFLGHHGDMASRVFGALAQHRASVTTSLFSIFRDMNISWDDFNVVCASIMTDLEKAFARMDVLPEQTRLILADVDVMSVIHLAMCPENGRQEFMTTFQPVHEGEVGTIRF